MLLHELTGVEHLPVLAALLGHGAAAGKQGLAGLAHVQLDALAQTGLPFLRRIQIGTGLRQFIEREVELFVLAEIDLITSARWKQAAQSLLSTV